MTKCWTDYDGTVYEISSFVEHERFWISLKGPLFTVSFQPITSIFRVTDTDIKVEAQTSNRNPANISQAWSVCYGFWQENSHRYTISDYSVKENC